MLDRGTALSITFTASDAQSACQKWIQARGQQGEFWSTVGQPAEQQSMACIFRYKTGATAEVDDGGGQILAQTMCANFAGSSGWTEDIAAEQATNAAVQQAQRQQQRQQAKQQAQQQAQQQVANDAGTVVSDVQAVQQDASGLAGDSLAGDLGGLQSDLSAVHGDLATVQSDTSDVVCGDAGVVSGDEASMEGDDGSMEGDISSFQNDIQSVLSAIASLKADQQTYLSDSARLGYHSTAVPTASQIAHAIAAGMAAVQKERAAFASARGQAAQMIAQAKGYVASANTICNSRGGG